MIRRCVLCSACGSRQLFFRGTATTASATEPLSPYEVLGVKHTAKSDELRAAYIELAKRFHPDQARTACGDLTTEEAAERFKEVQAAWYVLGDAERRQEFDEHGTLAASPAKMSTTAWLKLRNARPEDGIMTPNWGSDEPPLWIIVCGPVVMVTLIILFGSRKDISRIARDRYLLRNGGWTCEDCLIVNEALAGACRICNKQRYSPLPALGNFREQV
mmetsp:Transcript_6475/g.11240  ORF Transcript_6475/g.11240 Transcript_6475/m.11240 type:complete len:217 (-) Transcript_6475:11-661(-)